MGSRDYATFDGDKTYNVYCMRCGLKFKANECIMETDLRGRGLFVCKQFCYDGEHPQDFVRGVPDYQAVPIAQDFDGSSPFTANISVINTIEDADKLIGI